MKHHAHGQSLQDRDRLDTIYSLELLDRPSEPSFDRLTSLVTRLLHVPVALVSLVDTDRQFFVSCLGLPEPWSSRRETPLSHSFCQYVVETNTPLIIEDARNHPLVSNNLAIRDINIIAYLGIPLVTSDHMVLGSFCAIDTVPRVWQASDIAIVRDLAASVVTELELRRDIIARKQAEAALYESNARFGGAFRHASIGMALVGLDGRWLQVNESLCHLIGYTEQELLTTTFQRLTHPNDIDADVDLMHQVLRGEITTYQLEKRYIHKQEHLVWIVLNVSLVRDMHHQPQYFIAQIQDISHQRRQEWERQHLVEQLVEALDERDGLLQQVNDTLSRTEALYEVAGTLNRTHAMPAILQAVADSAAAVVPAHRTVLMIIDQAAQVITYQIEGGPGALHVAPLSFAELLDGLSGVVLREGQPICSLKGAVDARESVDVQQRRIHDRAGSIMVVPIQSQGTMLGTLTALNDVDGPDFTPDDMALLFTLANQAGVAIERTTLLAELQHHATTDGLTQLLNRRSWFEQSQRMVALAERSGAPLSVLIFDADHFKRINDTYGHAVGDLVLQTISELLQQIVRRSDLVGRYGGEEFVLLLPETAAPDAQQIAERLRQTIAALPVTADQHQLAITVSVGIATTQGTAIDLADLLAQADQALYAAKQAGRNCTRICSTDAA